MCEWPSMKEWTAEAPQSSKIPEKPGKAAWGVIVLVSSNERQCKQAAVVGGRDVRFVCFGGSGWHVSGVGSARYVDGQLVSVIPSMWLSRREGVG